MFGKSTEEKFSEILPGIKIKTLVHGEKTLMTKFILNGGSSLPRHSHPYEQTGYLISGKIKLTIGDDTFEVESGGSWCIDSGVAHSAEIFEDSSAIEIFSPPRADYIKFFSIQDTSEAE